MRAILFLILSGLFLRANATDPVAFQGSVVLNSGEVMVGQIHIPTFELVFVISGEKRLALPVGNISQVRVYDHQLKVNRKFIVQIIEQSGIERPALFEIVLWGDINVYRKPKQQFANSLILNHLDFDYYFVADDKIENLEKFSKRAYTKIVNEVGESMANFIRNKRLNPYHKADIIQIISHYNQSMKENHIVADLRL